jgi:hypothetical protein
LAPLVRRPVFFFFFQCLLILLSCFSCLHRSLFLVLSLLLSCSRSLTPRYYFSLSSCSCVRCGCGGACQQRLASQVMPVLPLVHLPRLHTRLLLRQRRWQREACRGEPKVSTARQGAGQTKELLQPMLPLPHRPHLPLLRPGHRRGRGRAPAVQPGVSQRGRPSVVQACRRGR